MTHADAELQHPVSPLTPWLDEQRPHLDRRDLAVPEARLNIVINLHRGSAQRAVPYMARP